MQQFYFIYMEGAAPLDVPRPDELPEPGDILTVLEEFSTPGGQVYLLGDELHLMDRTNDAPYGNLSSLGNWNVITKFGDSVWSNIEWAMAEGRIGKV